MGHNALLTARQLDQPGNIEDQRHSALTENGGTGNTIDTPEVGFETFDDNLLLTEQLVHQEAGMTAVGLHHYQKTTNKFMPVRYDTEQFVESSPPGYMRHAACIVRRC